MAGDLREDEPRGFHNGHDPARLPVSINSHTYVADTSQQASDEYYPTYAAMMNRIGRERGWSPMGRSQFEMGRSPHGALLVGSPEEVVQKILFEHELFGHKRFMAQISVGTLPHEKVLRAIELFGTEVAPPSARRSSGDLPRAPEDRQPAKMRRSASSHRRALLQSSLVTF